MEGKKSKPQTSLSLKMLFPQTAAPPSLLPLHRASLTLLQGYRSYHQQTEKLQLRISVLFTHREAGTRQGHQTFYDLQQKSYSKILLPAVSPQQELEASQDSNPVQKIGKKEDRVRNHHMWFQEKLPYCSPAFPYAHRSTLTASSTCSPTPQHLLVQQVYKIFASKDLLAHPISPSHNY